MWNTVLIIAMLVVVGPAAAEEPRHALSLGAGAFVPFDGDTGVQGTFGYERRIGSPFVVGAELEYRDYERDFFGVDDIETRSIVFRGIAKYAPLQGPLRPYIGAGIGIGVSVIDEDELEEALLLSGSDTQSLDEVALSLGILGLAGLDVMLAESFSLFVESRVSGDWRIAEERKVKVRGIPGGFRITSDTDVDVRNIGGFTGMAGVRWRF